MRTHTRDPEPEEDTLDQTSENQPDEDIMEQVTQPA
jgi:hypothetical protein